VAGAGERARAVLAPWLDRDPAAYCFDPRESMAARYAEARAERLARGDGSGGNRKPADARRPTARYTAGSLRTAVHRACDRLGLPRLNPYQLRHAFAAGVDEAFDIDHVQATLGHADPQVSRRYAKRSLKKAIDVARKLG
jgi:integrase